MNNKPGRFQQNPTGYAAVRPYGAAMPTRSGPVATPPRRDRDARGAARVEVGRHRPEHTGSAPQNHITDLCTEARICRARAPRSYRLHRLRRWRWDVVRYKAVPGIYPGVNDSRMHLSGDHGYTFTWRGAALAAARKVTRG